MKILGVSDTNGHVTSNLRREGEAGDVPGE